MRDFHQKSLKQIKLWAWAASVLPVVGIVALILIKLFGTDDIYSVIVIIGGTIIFSVSVVWWWWVMWTIAQVTTMLSHTSTSLDTVKKDLSTIRLDLEDEHNRERRKQNED